MATKCALLGVMVVVLVLPWAQAAVTVYNPAGLVVDILVDDKDVQVTTDLVTVNLTQAQQELQFKVAEGAVAAVSVQDGDLVVLIPDPLDPSNVQALKVEVGRTALLTPPNPAPTLPEVDSSLASPNPSPFPAPEIISTRASP